MRRHTIHFVATTAAGLLLAATVGAVPASADSAAATAMDSSVLLYTTDGLGAGFAVEGGRFVTAAHVVAGADTVRVSAGDETFTGTVLARDSRRDLAELRVPGLDLPALELQTAAPAVGDEVFAIGAPLGDYLQASTGIVSAVVTQDGVQRVQLDAAVNPGNSGGPLVSGDGTVAGVVVTKSLEGEGIGWATSATEVRDFLGARGGTERAGEAPQGQPTDPSVPGPDLGQTDAGSAGWLPWAAVAAVLAAAAAGLAAGRFRSRRQRSAPAAAVVLPPLDLTRRTLPPLDLTHEDLTGTPVPNDTTGTPVPNDTTGTPVPNRKDRQDQWI